MINEFLPIAFSVILVQLQILSVCVCVFIMLLQQHPCSQLGLYSTRIRPDPNNNNIPRCEIRRRNHQIRQIQTIGEDGRVFTLYSPGFELGNTEKYASLSFRHVDFDITSVTVTVC